MRFADPDTRAIPLKLVPSDGFDDWLSRQDEPARDWISANGFKGKAGELLRIPSPDLSVARVLFGWGSRSDHKRGRFLLARAATALKSGTYALDCDLSQNALEEAALGWLLAGYQFTRYKGEARDGARLRWINVLFAGYL